MAVPGWGGLWGRQTGLGTPRGEPDTGLRPTGPGQTLRGRRGYKGQPGAKLPQERPRALSHREHQLGVAGSPPQMPQHRPGGGQQSTAERTGRHTGQELSTVQSWSHARHKATQAGSTPRTRTPSPGPTGIPAQPHHCPIRGLNRTLDQKQMDEHAHARLKYGSP